MNLTLRPMRFGILLSLVSVFMGFALGGFFGAAEDTLKNDLKARAAAVVDTVYGGDEAKATPVIEKSWAYYKRAHLDAGAIGTFTLLAALLLAIFSGPSPLVKSGLSLILGMGACGYSLFWLLAGMMAPTLGSTGANESASARTVSRSSGRG